MIGVTVELGDRSYPVLVGAGARHRLLEHVPARAKRVAVVTQESIGVEVDAGVPTEVLHIGEGEKTKTLETVFDLCRSFVKMDLTRNDCVVAVGGGLVTDVAGFAAAIYHRGTAVINVPTTLLGQIDAGIGGKTGVNLPEGKNLVGAVWQPTAVLCDTDVLTALPPREYLSGCGEMAKYHFIAPTLGYNGPPLEDMALGDRIAACVAMKAVVVGSDEREGGLRAILNYGHTLAHALEIATDYDLRHGEAVAIGIHFAAVLARRLDRIDSARVAEHVKVLEFYGLPTELPAGSDHGQLVDLMRRDKKAVSGLTFVLDAGPRLEVVTGVGEKELEESLEEIEG